MTKTLTWPRRFALAAGLLLMCGGLGCYGQFALTRKIHDWNGRATNNKFANSVITWGLIIIPVYEVCALADFVVFNTIEVFSGRNPVAEEDGAGGLRVRYAGRDYQLAPTDDGAVEVRSAGVAPLRYRVLNDHVVVTDGAGRTVKTIDLPRALAQSRRASGY
jgi:hypothetical protein